MYDDGDVNESHSSYISKRKPVIVCGDLNVAATARDLANPTANRNNAGFTEQERGKFAELLDSGFVDTFRLLHPEEIKYSWWSYRFKARERNAGWRIDYFLISDFAKGLVTKADILTDVYGSDHCPVLLQVDI
jgi:exodeoxyribonuclease-3